jgi:hypothetical protein
MYDGGGHRDDADDGVITHLKCDVEMEFEGPNDATMNKWAADVLRRWLTALRRTSSVAKTVIISCWIVSSKVGEVYINYDGELGIDGGTR